MKPNTKAPGRHRIAREDCEVGDWVDAVIAPEWSAELPSHVFRRSRISLSPVDGAMGGMLPDQAEEWIFVGDRRESGFAWVRES